MRQRLLTIGVLATILTAGAAPAVAGPTTAVPATAVPATAVPDTFGCKWPRVCLYKTSADWVDRKPTASYQQMTQDFQMLGPRGRHAYAIYNSRIDDSVWLLFADGTEGCLDPNGKWFHNEIDPPERVVGLLIVDEPSCLPPE